MSITLTSDGQTVTLPQGWRINSESQTVPGVSDKLIGRRGVQTTQRGQREQVKTIVIGGRMKAATSTALMVIYDNIQKAQGQGSIVYLTESVQARTIKCIISNTNWIKRSGLIIHGQITLLGIDGAWTDSIGTQPVSTNFTVSEDDSLIVSGNSALLRVWYTGSAPTRANMLVKANAGWSSPKVEWMGGNLIKNSSFAEIADGATAPTNWNQHAGNPVQWQNSFGRSDNFSAMIPDNSGGLDNVLRSDTFLVNPDVEYTVSCYIYADGVNDYRLNMRWHSSTTFAANSTVPAKVTGSSEWSRIEQKFTAPDYASSASVMVRGNNANPAGSKAWVDDVQVNVGATATTYFNTNIARNKHISLSRSNTTGVVDPDDQLLIDAKSDRIMRWDTTAGTFIEESSAWDGHFFELMPGENLIGFKYASGSKGLSVRIEYSNEYF